jgi:prepilin-type N-terminal cleavage/methylation domain-containing protein
MKPTPMNPQCGFSVIELLMVIVVLAILSTLALLQLTSSKTDFERQRIVKEFKIHLERARFDSVKRRPEAMADRAKIILTGPSAFTAHLDIDEDGQIELPSESRTIDFTDRSSTVIKLTEAFNYPITISFNRRGHVEAKDNLGTDIAPLFKICSDCSADDPDVTMISVSETGTVAVLREGQEPTALPSPETTNTTPVINCYVLAQNTNSDICVPN